MSQTLESIFSIWLNHEKDLLKYFTQTCFNVAAAPLAPVIDTQRSLAYDQLFLCWRLPPDSAPAWYYSVEYRRRGVVPGGTSRGGIRGGLAAARWGWQRLDDVNGASAVIDRLEMDSVYVLRVRGCNKAGYGEYSEEVYLHTPPAPGEQTKPSGMQEEAGVCLRSDTMTSWVHQKGSISLFFCV